MASSARDDVTPQAGTYKCMLKSTKAMLRTSYQHCYLKHSTLKTCEILLWVAKFLFAYVTLGGLLRALQVC